MIINMIKESECPLFWSSES